MFCGACSHRMTLANYLHDIFGSNPIPTSLVNMIRDEVAVTKGLCPTTILSLLWFCKKWRYFGSGPFKWRTYQILRERWLKHFWCVSLKLAFQRSWGEPFLNSLELHSRFSYLNHEVVLFDCQWGWVPIPWKKCKIYIVPRWEGASLTNSNKVI